MNIQPDQKVIISPEVLFQEVSGEIVLLDLASESYFGLDEIGARIWALLNEEKTVGQIVGVLLEGIVLANNCRYSGRQINEIKSLIEVHNDELISAWKQHFSN